MSAAKQAASDAASATSCAICGGTESDPQLLARCYGCGRSFHLNPYAAPGTDCGDIWAGSTADEEFTGLELYCSPCLLRGGRPQLTGEDALPGVEALAPGAAWGSVVAPPPRSPRPPWPRRYRRRDADAR